MKTIHRRLFVVILWTIILFFTANASAYCPVGSTNCHSATCSTFTNIINYPLNPYPSDIDWYLCDGEQDLYDWPSISGTNMIWTCMSLESPNNTVWYPAHVTVAQCATAVKFNGSCGNANGQYFNNTPTTWLCEMGTSTSVQWTGPWSWSCSWANWGTNASCSANKSLTIGNNAQCGMIHATEIDHTPTQNELCTAGTPSILSWTGPWSWSCSATQSWGGLNSSEVANCWANPTCEETTVTEAPVVCDMNNWRIAWVCYTPSKQATFIVTNNKVGINTMNPEYELDVNGTMRAAEVLVLSDERVKENITKIDNALEKIRQINGYTFTWKKDGRPDMWVLAQEIEKVFADAVRTDTNGTKTVQYNALIAPILEAIKELNTLIDSHIEKANKQANDITKLEQKIK